MSAPVREGIFRPDRGFTVVAGPCVLEDPALNLRIARHLRDVSLRLGVPAVFKASFDKANRTSLRSPRGPGIDDGLPLLRQVRDEADLPVLTDVHEPRQAERAADAVDALQIPAFLCRQTDLLVAAGRTGLPVNVKKGQWMAPEQIAHSVEKVRAGGCEAVAVTERGTAFGYGRWIVDMRSFAVVREASGCPVLYDVTHSVQLPGGEGDRSGGERRFAGVLARAAVAAGAGGVYLETHPRPEEAPSDGPTMLPLDRLEPLLADLLALRRATAAPEAAGRSAVAPDAAGRATARDESAGSPAGT